MYLSARITPVFPCSPPRPRAALPGSLPPPPLPSFPAASRKPSPTGSRSPLPRWTFPSRGLQTKELQWSRKMGEGPRQPPLGAHFSGFLTDSDWWPRPPSPLPPPGLSKRFHTYSWRLPPAPGSCGSPRERECGRGFEPCSRPCPLRGKKMEAALS